VFLCRCKQWVTNCRTKSLEKKSAEELNKHFRLCSLHFEQSQFMNISCSSLIWCAIPTIFNVPNPPRPLHSSRRKLVRHTGNSVTNSNNQCCLPNFHTYASQAPSTSSASHQFQQSPTKVILRHKLHVVKKKLSQARVTLHRREHTPIVTYRHVACQKCKKFQLLPKAQQSFFEMQLEAVNTRRQGMRYSDQNKLLALGIYYKSPAAYRFLQRQFCLPSYETLRSFISSMTVSTGFKSDLTEALRLRAQSLSQKERYVVILFDGMALRSSLKYINTADKVDGFVDLCDFASPATDVAHTAVQFMVRGISTKWKHPVGHFFAGHAVPAASLQQMIRSVIDLLHSMQLVPLAVVCDQESGHRSCLSQMGVTIQHPWITCEQGNCILGRFN